MVVQTRNSANKAKRTPKVPSSASSSTRKRSSRRINQYKLKINDEDEDNVSIVSDEEQTTKKPKRASKRSTSSSRQKTRCDNSRNHNESDREEEDIPVRRIEGDSNHNNILISPRQNEFSERTWWMVDFEQEEDEDGPTNQGATPLAKRCMREHGWNEDKTRKVLKAYRQFLILKKEHKDWDATKLSPSYLVDLMWHQHLLDVVNYCHDTMLLCGHVVGHNPDGALRGKTERDAFTRKALDQRFPNKYDKDIWGIQSYQEAAASPAPKLNIRVKNQTGEESYYKIGRSTKMKKVFSLYADYKQVPLAALRFLLDGDRIDPEATAKELELEDDDQIDVILSQVGC